MDARSMLDEYFSFGLSDMGDLESLPLLLPGYTPDLDKLPLLLLRLALQVDWEDEKACFDTFLHELAFFYSLSPPPIVEHDSTRNSQEEEDMGRGEEERERERKEAEEATKRCIEHVVWPTAKQYFVAPEGMLRKDVVQVTSLEALYRVFERC